jgi:hypothetical protein
MRNTKAIAGLALLALSAQSAIALPVPTTDAAATAMPTELVASWRYNNNCAWQGGRWVVDLGAGRLVLCRPNRPSRDYAWRNEGSRQGWYDRRNRAWHYNNW